MSIRAGIARDRFCGGWTPPTIAFGRRVAAAHRIVLTAKRLNRANPTERAKNPHPGPFPR